MADKHPEVYADLKAALAAHVARFARVPYRPPSGIGPGEIGPPRVNVGQE